jgi:hypothetical protein
MNRSFAVGMGLVALLALGAWNGPRAVVQAAGQATAQATPAPSVDEILERAMRASGGREAWKRLTSVRMKGTAEIAGMDAPGSFDIQAKAPNKVLQTITLGPMVIRQAFDGQQGWKDLPGQGVQDLTGGELSQFKRDAEFYGELKFKELYPQITYLGEEDVNNRPAYVLRAVPTDGAARKFYFDKENGLRVRTDDEEGVGGNPPTQSYFEDYKEMAGTGVKMPATIRIVAPTMTVVLRLEEMAANVAIDDAVFAKPAAETTGTPAPDEK